MDQGACHTHISEHVQGHVLKLMLSLAGGAIDGEHQDAECRGLAHWLHFWRSVGGPDEARIGAHESWGAGPILRRCESRVSNDLTGSVAQLLGRTTGQVKCEEPARPWLVVGGGDVLSEVKSVCSG